MSNDLLSKLTARERLSSSAEIESEGVATRYEVNPSGQLYVKTLSSVTKMDRNPLCLRDETINWFSSRWYQDG